MTRTIVTALLLVGLGLAAAQTNTSTPAPTPAPLPPVMIGDIFPDAGGNAGTGTQIYMVSPQEYAGPYNGTWFITGGGQGFTVTFGEIPRTRGSRLRVSACDDPSCMTSMFLGYAAPNVTLASDSLYGKIDFSFETIVEPGFFPIDIADRMPCSVPLTDQCVVAYAGLFGCLPAQTPGVFKFIEMPVHDPCYKHVVAETCIVEACTGCASTCVAPNVTGTPPCDGVCANLNSPFGHCAPSCQNVFLGNGMCQPECNNYECFFDGGDCGPSNLPTSGIVPVAGTYGAQFRTADANGDGVLSFAEMTAPNSGLTLAFPTKEAFDALDMDMESGLDLFEFVAAFPIPNMLQTVDHILDDQVSMDRLALSLGLQLLGLADSAVGSTQNRYLSREEAEFFYNMGSEDFDTFMHMARFPKDQSPPRIEAINGEAIARVLYGIYISLSGRTLADPPFNNMAATKAAISIVDRNEDKMLSALEAKMLGFSAELFFAMDADMDGKVSVDELYEMQREQMAAGCAGVVLLTDRESEVKTKAPLAGAVPRVCSFLMLPDWFYPDGIMDRDHEAAAAGTTMGRRRLLSASKGAPVAPKTVVMSRKTGPVPNHHLLSAKAAHKVQHVNHGRRLLQVTTTTPPLAPGGKVATELDFGIAFNATEMPWIVQAKTLNNMTMTWDHACIGALIHPSYVILAASCTLMADQPGDIQLHFSDGSMGMSSKVHVNPLFDARGQSPAALVELQMPKDGLATVQLHDGAGLDLSECKMPVIAVGVAPAQMYPSMARQSVEIVESDNCTTEHDKINRISAVSPMTVCGLPRNRAPKYCFEAMDDSLLLAAHPEHPEQYVLVGLRTMEGNRGPQASSCMEPGVPSLWSHVAGSLNWILSLPTFGKFPAQLLSVEVEDLTITDGMAVVVVTGSEMAGGLVGAIQTKCSRGGTYYDDDALGSLIVQISSPPAMKYFDSSVHLDFDVSGCGSRDIPTGKPGSLDATMCEALRGCKAEGDAMSSMPMTCEAPKCEFDKDWKYVTKELQAHGKAFTGGLGGEAEVNGAVEYRQWMCARDWDVEEQMACNVGPGELACFRFEEKEDSFDSFGRNAHKKIVSAPKLMEGVGKEKRGLTSI